MVPLNAWLHKIRRADSPLCPHCHRKEDITHFVFFYSRFTPQRLALKSALGRRAH
ncbi:hypothetical protein C8F01DRAFT_1002641 [Mycena amicta]|nr:hypothetical protein C8F01DRAFT_1002641 [Mycena amicta]